MNENEIFDHLLDDAPEMEQEIQEQDDRSMDAILGIPSTEDSEYSEELELESETKENNDEDIISVFLKNKGILDPSKIQFEGENGTLEELDFKSLDKEEQLNILNELTDPHLSNHEIEIINYLRKNQVSFGDVVDYYANQKLQAYLSSNPEMVPQKTYSIDEYSDDELYLADLKYKYPSFTDEELLSKLNIAKADESLFEKEVDVLRQSYKAEEDRAREEALYAEQQEYETLKNNLINATSSFGEIVLDYTDPKSDSIVIEDSDRNQILGYLLNQDKDGKSQFVKDIENPETLIELAWYRINGQNTLTGVTQYWKNILKEERKERANLEKQLEKYKNKEQKTVIKNRETTNSPSGNLDFWDRSGLI